MQEFVQTNLPNNILVTHYTSSSSTIQGMLQLQYDRTGYNIAVQGVPADGQLFMYVHIHILLINDGDLDWNNKIYDRFKEWAPRADHQP